MAGKIQKGDVLVIRYEGPKGSPGMPEMLSPGSALVGAGLGKYVALVTDGRFSGASHGIMVGHAAVGGPIGLLVDGDMVTVRPGNRELSELAARRREWQPPAPKPGSFGTLGKYASQVSACGSHDVLSGLYIAEQNRLKSGDASVILATLTAMYTEYTSTIQALSPWTLDVSMFQEETWSPVAVFYVRILTSEHLAASAPKNMLTPISLARAKVVTPRRPTKEPEESANSYAAACDKGDDACRSRASSRTLSPEDLLPRYTQGLRLLIVSRSFGRRLVVGEEHLAARLRQLESRVQALEDEHREAGDAGDAAASQPPASVVAAVKEDLWNDLFAELRLEAERQTSSMASKTEEQLAAADKQLAEMLSKAEHLIQQSAAQAEERLAKHSEQLLRQNTHLSNGHTSASTSEMQASRRHSFPLNTIRENRAPQQIFQRSAKAEAPAADASTIPTRQHMEWNYEPAEPVLRNLCCYAFWCRILPKLFKALASNTHLKQLMLGNTGLESDKGLHWDVAEACHGKIQKCSAQKPEETGTVNSWNVQRQFGFVSCDSSRQDVFLHAEAFKDLDVRDRVKKSGLQRGDHVRFDVKDTGRGKKPEAKNVELDEQGRAGDRKRGRSRRSDSRSPPRRRSSDCFRIGETEGCINQLADALRSNSTLQKLDLQANFLEMCDLTVIFEALSENTGLQDLKVNFQACAKQSFKDSMLEQGNDVYKAAAAAFRTNRSLIKLDLILLQRHWQDQICRGLMQNRQELRKSEIVTRAGG
eukprot:symbB.v1.2.025894.t2/scaffold2547.1/size76550/6